MNDVMKKRLIGVVIIIAIGVLVPVLLSQCMGSNDEASQSGEMRVYSVDNNGTAKRASDDADTDEQTPDMPDAVSPQREESANAEPSSDDESFETPPVAGRQSDDAASDDRASDEPADTPADTPAEEPREEPAPAPTRKRSSPEPAAEPAPAPQRSQSSGYDYGASTQGSNRSSNRSTPSQPAPSPSSASSSGLERSRISGWVVQVGSFSEQSNASDLARQLSANFTASYTPATINGRTLYRVNVGPFANEGEARSAANRLSQQGRNGLVRNLP